MIPQAGLRAQRRRRALAVVPMLLAALALAVGVLPPATAAEGVVRGTVTELGTGTPVGGVTVQAFCWQVPGATQGDTCGQTQTGADGSYTLAVEPGTYKVFFDHHPTHRAQFYGGGTTVASADSLPVVVASGGSVDSVDAALVRLWAVTGTVTGSGQPLAGINVTAHQEQADPGDPWRAVQSTQTGPDGSWSLRLASGRYRIGFADPNGPYRAEFHDDAATLAEATDVVVADADLGGLDADLAANHPVTGLVQVDGVDMPGVTVIAWQSSQAPGGPPPGPGDWEAVKTTVTGEDGRYTLFLPDGVYRIAFSTVQGRFPTVYYDGASSLETADDVVVAGAEVPDIDARIFADEPGTGPAVTGTVTVQGSGAPVDGMLVVAHRWHVLSSSWVEVRSVLTGPDGSYALHVPEGPYRIGFRHPLLRFQPVYYDGRATVEEADEVVVPTEGLAGIDAQVVENRALTGTVTADPVEGLPPGAPPTMVEALRWSPQAAAWEPVSLGFTEPGGGDYRVHVPDGSYRLRFTPFFEAFEPVYFDGVDSVGEATDVVVDGADVGGLDAHLVVARQDTPPQWPRASTLSAAGQDGWGPAVSVAPDGGVTAAWSRRDGSHARVQASTRGGDGSWRPPVNLSPPGEDAVDPQVSAGRRGAAVAVWRRWDGARHQVQAATRGAGGWGSPVTLSRPGGDAWDPQVVMGERGSAVAVWRQSDGQGSQVYAATLGPHGRWSEPERLSADGADAWDARVATARDGSAVVAWTRTDGAHGRVEAVTRVGQGRWSAPAPLSSAGAQAADPQVAVNAAGTAAVVWREWQGDSERIVAATASTGEAWSPPEHVSPAGQSAHQPHVAVHPDGALTAVWVRWDGGHERVQAASREPDQPWSPPTRLSRVGVDAQWPQVAAGGDGGTTAVWLQSDGFEQVPRAATRRPGVTWSVPTRIAPSGETAFGDRASGPTVAAGPEGTVAVVWEQRSGSVDRVRGVVRVDPPGEHCTNGFGVDLNLLFGVPEPFVFPPCTVVPAQSEWRPLTIWVTSTGFEAVPPGFVPAGTTPLEDLAAKLEAVRVVVDGGTKRERVQVFAPGEAVRLDRVLSEFVPWEGDHPMAVSIPRMRGLQAGEHTVEVIWRLRDQHCDGFSEIEELSCLPAGERSFGMRRFTVVSPDGR